MKDEMQTKWLSVYILVTLKTIIFGALNKITIVWVFVYLAFCVPWWQKIHDKDESSLTAYSIQCQMHYYDYVETLKQSYAVRLLVPFYRCMHLFILLLIKDLLCGFDVPGRVLGSADN